MMSANWKIFDDPEFQALPESERAKGFAAIVAGDAEFQTLPDAERAKAYAAVVRPAKAQPPVPEAEFRSWYSARASQFGLDPDPDNPEHHYDYRAAYAAGVEPDESGHWPSMFKSDDHPRRFLPVGPGGQMWDTKYDRPRDEAARTEAFGTDLEQLSARTQATQDALLGGPTPLEAKPLVRDRGEWREPVGEEHRPVLDTLVRAKAALRAGLTGAIAPVTGLVPLGEERRGEVRPSEATMRPDVGPERPLLEPPAENLAQKLRRAAQAEEERAPVPHTKVERALEPVIRAGAGMTEVVPAAAVGAAVAGPFGAALGMGIHEALKAKAEGAGASEAIGRGTEMFGQGALLESSGGLMRPGVATAAGRISNRAVRGAVERLGGAAAAGAPFVPLTLAQGGDLRQAAEEAGAMGLVDLVVGAVAGGRMSRAEGHRALREVGISDDLAATFLEGRDVGDGPTPKSAEPGPGATSVLDRIRARRAEVGVLTKTPERAADLVSTKGRERRAEEAQTRPLAQDTDQGVPLGVNEDVTPERPPDHIVRSVADPPKSVSDAVVVKTKQETKATLGRAITDGLITSETPVRLTDTKELHDIVLRGEMSEEKAAQYIVGRDGKPLPIVGYGDGISAAVIVPKGYSREVSGLEHAQPNEVKIAGVPVQELRFVIDGHRRVLSFDELEILVRGGKLGPVPVEPRAAAGPSAGESVLGRIRARRRAAMAAGGEGTPATKTETFLERWRGTREQTPQSLPQDRRSPRAEGSDTTLPPETRPVAGEAARPVSDEDFLPRGRYQGADDKPPLWERARDVQPAAAAEQPWAPGAFSGQSSGLEEKVASERAGVKPPFLDRLRAKRAGEVESEWDAGEATRTASNQVGGTAALPVQASTGFLARLRQRREAARSVDSTATPVGRADVTAYLSKAFGVPIRVGHFRQRAEGIFKVKPETIRTRTADDIATVAHEVGHAINAKVLGWNAGLKAWRGPGGRELEQMGRELYGAKRPAAGYAREGFAEYLAHWLATEQAPVKAPRFHAWFEGTFLPRHPEVAEKLHGARELFTRWSEQSAEARVLGQIDFKGTEPSATWAERRRALRKGLTDRFAVLQFVESEMLQGAPIEPAKSPYQLARVTSDTAGAKARQFVRNGVFNFAGQRTAPGLKEVLAPIAGEIKPFLAYAYSRRALELLERDINPGITREDAQHVVDQYDSLPEFRGALDGIKRWSNALVDYLADAGGLSSEAAQAIKDSSLAYIPLKRVFVDAAGGGRNLGRKLVDLGQPVKRLRGSGRRIQDPIESLIEMAQQIIATADKARVARALAELAEGTEGGGRWMERVDAPQSVHRASVDDMAGQLERAGADLSHADRDAMLTVFTNAPAYYGKENIVAVWRDGKRVFYEVDPELYGSLKGMDDLTLPWFINVTAGRARRAITLGATGIRAGFQLITNPTRDTWEAMLATSDKPLTQPLRALQALRDEWQGAEHVQRWRAAGGEMGQPLGLDRRYLSALREEILANTAGAKARAKLRHPIETLREVLSFTEAMNRIAEFKAVEERWGPETENAQVAGALAAADLTVDFRRAGVYSRIANQVIPFFNPTVQGISRNVRLMWLRPGRTAIRAVALLTSPALALWWWNKDEEWYQELPLWERVGFLHFKTGNNIVRVPLPFEFGYEFAAVPVAVAESVREGRPDEFKKVVAQIATSLPPDIIPGIVKPTAEAAFNYDLFRGRPIESPALQRVMAGERFTPATSEVYKWLGRKINVSPIKLQHVVDGYTGGLASDFTNALKTSESTEAADLPVIGRLFSRQKRPGRSVGELFDVARQAEEIHDTLLRLRRAGRDAEADNLEREHVGELKRLPALRAVTRRVRALEQNGQLAEATQLAREVLR